MSRHLPLIAVLVVVLALAMWPAAIRADSPGDAEAMAATNSLYESGRYLEAALVYEQLIDQGYESGALYYNLGNAYFKQGDLGRTILSYRRAERLYPRDADIRANLEIARDRRIDGFDEGRGASTIETATSPVSRLTLDELAQITLAVWIVLAFLAVVLLYAKRRTVKRGAVYGSVVVGLALLLSAGATGERWYSESADHEAVIVAEVVDVVSGPGTTYVTKFTLHGGTEARLLEQRGSWTRLALPGSDLQGWVPSNAVEEL
jgi:tetratricopeptide (TPR) repeat protein